MPSPKDLLKLFQIIEEASSAGKGAAKGEKLLEAAGKLPKGTAEKQLEAELMFRRLAEEQAARYAPVNPATEQGNASLDEIRRILAPKTPNITKAHGGEVQHFQVGGISKVFKALSNIGKGERSLEAAQNLMRSGRELSVAERQFVAEQAAKQSEELARERFRPTLQLGAVEAKKSKGPSPKPARAKPKTKAEINAIAERVAPQMTGEFVRAKPGESVSVAGKSKKQFDLEQELEHDIQRSREVPEAENIDLEPHRGSVMLSLPGDISIADYDIFGIGGEGLRMPSRQYGGPRFGLGHPEEAGWASTLVPAAGFQRRVNAASQQYGGAPVLANFMAMGPEGLNYAEHYADTLLKLSKPEQMTPRNIDHFNRIIRSGNAKAEFPDFPGIEHPEASYLYMIENPEARKHYNSVMQLTKTTEELGLPSGLNVRHAVSEPELRDLERGMTGFSVLQMEPGVANLKPSMHPTYSHDIPGKFLGRTDILYPYEMTFPDTVAGIRANPQQAKSEFGTLQMLGGKQVIDNQLLDELEQYRRRIKELTGKKDGSVVHMAGGNEPGQSIGEMFKPKPLTIPEPLTDLVDAFKRQFSREKRSMSKPGAATDVLLRGPVAFAAGTPMDLLGMGGDALDYLQKKIPGLRKNASVMDQQRSVVDKRQPEMGYAPKVQVGPDGMMPYGTEHFQEKLNQAGLTTGEERPLLELGTAIASPFAAQKALQYGKAGAKVLAPTAQDMLQMSLEKLSEPTRSYVIKPKGGNWFSHTVEGQTDPLKIKTQAGTLFEDALAKMQDIYTPEHLATMSPQTRSFVEARFPQVSRGAAVNKWVDKKLNNYIKNEMGTVEDPIRLGIERRAVEAEKLKVANQARLDKMAADIERAKAAGKGTAVSERDLERAKEKFADEEYIASQGLHHDIIPEEGWNDLRVWEPASLDYKRVDYGMPKGLMATHPAAKDWEIKADTEISSLPARAYQSKLIADTPLIQENPWVANLDPNAKIYMLDQDSAITSGFSHMIDELHNALDPASTLPANLKITAKDLEKMNVDDVSALVGKINAWRDVQKTKANLEIANNPATHIFKEYPAENNPKGVSWRQIKRPEGYSDEEAEKFVRQAAQYEGDIMRHCVGGAGHCEPLLNGDVELYTLRDAKGEPHVTIEMTARPDVRMDGNRPVDFYNSLSLDEMSKIPALPKNASAMDEVNWNRSIIQSPKYQAWLKTRPRAILEIKGKGNRKPKDEYIPFVQDFVRSGNFSYVGDLHHTDLFDVTAGLHSVTPKSFSAPEGDRLIAITAAKRAGEPLKGLMTREEWEPIVQKYLPKQKAAGGAVTMAAGGAVDYESKFNQMLQDHVADMAEGGAVDYESRFNDMLQKHVQGMAEGGEVENSYNNDPDMADGGRFIQAPAFANGGAVKSIWTVN
jgi:hypothetical protein